MNLDRTPLDSKYVQSKQNFDNVLANYKAIKPPIWKNPWFYGPVGLASIAIAITLSLNTSNTITDDKNVTKLITELPKDTECIHPPIEKQDVTFQNFEVNPLKDEKIELASGTKIEFPKGSLLPENPTKNVTIRIREFDTKSEAFVAGVLMDCKDNEAFESAGMIEVRGVQNGEEVKVNADKPFKVDLVLTKNPQDFQFWKLDEKSNKWNNYEAAYNYPSKKEVSKVNPVKECEDKIQQLNELIELKTKEISHLIEPQKRDYLLPIKGNQRFDVNFDEKQFPELEKMKGVEFEVDTKIPYDRSFSKKVWSNVDLTKKEDNYIIEFSNTPKDKIQIPVRPILKGEKKLKAEESFNKIFNEYQQKKTDLLSQKEKFELSKTEQDVRLEKLIESAKKAISNDAANTNLVSTVSSGSNSITSVEGYSATFTSSSWGVFNCDKPITYPKSYEEELAFTYQNNAIVEAISIFVFDKDKDVRFTFGYNGSHNITQFGFHKKDKNTLFIIDREGDIGYVSDFSESDIQNGRVKITRLSKKDVNLTQLQKLIDESRIDS